MKNRLSLLLFVAVLSVSTHCNADIENKSVTIEQRLREVDLSLTLHQYERVQMEAFNAQLEIDLLDTDGQITQAERERKTKLLQKRISIFRQRADELRNIAVKLGQDDVARTTLNREKAILNQLLYTYTRESPEVKNQEKRVRELEATAK